MSRLVSLAGCCIVLLATGCDVSDPNAKARPVGNPPGIAPAGMDPVGNQPALNPQPGAPPQVGQQAAPQQPANDGKGIIGKMTSEVVHYQDAIRENPNFEIIENKAQGDDLLSFYGSAYINARSRASMFGFEAWLKQQKVVEERNPTYAELVQAMKEYHIQFTARPPWDKYAYDSEKGVIVVIQDKKMRAERYEEKGIGPTKEEK